MDITAILSDLREQRDRLQQAIDALERNTQTAGKLRSPKRGRHMSVEGRAKIAAAARARWAKAKRAGKRTLAA
jgi:hypothetical protein